MRVLIIDDRDAEVFRDRLVNWSTLDSEVDQVEVETTLIGVRAALAVDKELPDVIVLDGYFPERVDEQLHFNAEKVIELLAQHPSKRTPKVVLVSGHPDIREHWDMVVEWLDSSQLADVLPKTDLGELTSLLLVKRIDLMRELLAYELSPRQEEVLRLISLGCSNSEIAKQLFIAESTVKKHLEEIYKLLAVSNRTNAAIKAIRGSV